MAHARARDPRRVCQGEGRRPMPGAVGRSVGRRRGQPHGVGASAKVGAQRVWVVTTGARALPSAWGGWPMNRLRARTVAGSTNSAMFSLYLTVMSPATSGNAGRHARVSGSHLREQRSTQPPGPPRQPAQTQALHIHTHTYTHTHTHTARAHTETHGAHSARGGQQPRARSASCQCGGRGSERSPGVWDDARSCRSRSWRPVATGHHFCRRNENGMCACSPTPLEPARRWSVNTRCGSPLMVTDLRSAAYICECGHCTADFANVHVMCPVSR